jgi:hypothetical protein
MFLSHAMGLFERRLKKGAACRLHCELGDLGDQLLRRFTTLTNQICKNSKFENRHRDMISFLYIRNNL